MDSLTGRELLLALLGSSGFIGGLISLLTYLANRYDKRREKRESETQLEISKSADMRRYELDSTNSVHQQLWEIIRQKDVDIHKLEDDVEILENKAVLTRPAILQIFANLRKIRHEIESLNVMVLNEEETNVFMRRFQNVKQLLDETEKLMP